METILNKLSLLCVEQLAEIAVAMYRATTDEASIMLDATLSTLETKMEESDFVRFCEKLS